MNILCIDFNFEKVAKYSTGANLRFILGRRITIGSGCSLGVIQSECCAFACFFAWFLQVSLVVGFISI